VSAPSSSSSGNVLTIDWVCDQFEAEWRARRGPRIEDYLRRVAAPDRPTLLRELLAVELEYRLRQGERPLLAEYRPRFAEYARVVESAFAKPAPTRPAPTRPAAPVPRGPAGGALKLTVTEGPHKGQTATFVGHDVFLVGRSKQAALSLPEDKRASRNHFVLECNLPDCRLTDLGSRHGTFVNGERVPTADLHDGDVVTLGQTMLVVSMLAPAGGAAEEDRETTVTASAAPTPQWMDLPTVAPASSPTGPAPAAPGAGLPRVAGYRVERELGRGGMGVVYLAVKEADGSRVALKTIIPAAAISPRQTQIFLREVEILSQLDHPNIVRFRDRGEANGLPFLVMDYVEGTDARKVLRQDGPLPVRRAVSLVGQLLRGLKYAHDKGIVHRDIKPANLLIATENGAELVKIADFGLSRIYQESRMSGLTIKGDVGGTIHFMPPEQITQFRQVKPAADQYSAAATLYNLLTDRFLFDAGQETIDKAMGRVLQEQPVPVRDRRPDIPEGPAAAIHRALAKDPKDRFPDVEAFRAALAPFAR
jgi:serine/threonine-protein kinase